jgi:surface protein
MRFGMGMGLGLGSRGGGGGSPDMILVYTIPAPSTKIQLAIQANSTWFSAGQKVVINWGDDSATETVSAASGHTGYIGHTYASARTYTIKISGSMTMYGRDSGVDILGQTLLTRVDSFGKLGLTSFLRAFRGCTGLTSVPKTLPSSVTNMSEMFSRCDGAAFNPDVSKWNVSNVENMASMFYYCRGAAFNPDVSKWNVSKVENMTYMFRYCSVAAGFNPDVSRWDVSKVKNMSFMFGDCAGAGFNPDVSKWDVSKVEYMQYMFYNCYGAILNPDVSKWNVSKVTDMSYMFYNCGGAAFNPNIKKWTLKTGVTTTIMFTASKIQPTTWLDELLVAWAANPNQGNNVTINFSPNKFTVDSGDPLPAVADALTTLEGKGWTIATANPYSST